MVLIVDGGGMTYVEPEPEPEPTEPVPLAVDSPPVVNPIITFIADKYDVPIEDIIANPIVDSVINPPEPTITPVGDKILNMVADGQGITVDALVYNIDKIIPIPVISNAVQAAHPLDDLTSLEKAKLELEFNLSRIKKTWEGIRNIGVPLLIGVGVVGSLLYGYQYSKSYIGEKGAKKARG